MDPTHPTRPTATPQGVNGNGNGNGHASHGGGHEDEIDLNVPRPSMAKA